MKTAITIALAPAIAFGLFIYQKDRYDREPLQLLLSVFFLGAFSVIPVYFVELFLSSINPFSGTLSILFISFIIAGFTEEFFKRLVVLKTAYNSQYYNEKLDGIVYCVFSSLGFAAVENIMYILGGKNIFYIGITRGIFSVPAHMLFAITMGYYLSLSKYAKDIYEEKNFISKSLYIPIILHGIYDFILMSGFKYLFIIFIIFVIYLWKINLNRLNEYVKESKIQNLK